MTKPAPRAVSHQYFIRARPREVFRAISDPAWLTRWLCDRAAIEPRKGGRYRLGWTDGPTHRGRLTAFVSGRKIAMAWSWPGQTLAGTVFSLTVKRSAGGSLLVVEHSGFPREEGWTDLYGSAEWGWTYFAVNLKSLLEHGHDLRSPRDG